MSNEIDLVVGSVAFKQITDLLVELGKVDGEIKKIGESAIKMNTALGVKDTASLTKLSAENAKLNKEIEKLIGSAAVLETKLANATAAQAKSTKATTDALIAEEKLIAAKQKNADTTEKNANKEVKASQTRSKYITQETIDIRLKNKELAQEYTELSKNAGAYDKHDAQYKKMAKSLKDMAFEGKEGTKEFIKLENELTTLGNRLKSVDAITGSHTRNVGNYASSWNGLGNSINQLTREAPAFANSLQTGFMALSNNIPILTDELGVLIAKNKALQAVGKPTESILKTVTGAFFSWQTAISLGVTILTVYGAKIWEMITAGDKAAESQKKLNNELLSVKNTVTAQMTQLTSLVDIVNSSTESEKNRQLAYDEIKKTLPGLTSATYNQAIATGELKNATDLYVTSLIQQQLVETQVKSISDEQTKLNEKKSLSYNEYIGKVESWLQSLQPERVQKNLKKSLTTQRELEEGNQQAIIDNRRKGLVKLQEDFLKTQKSLAQFIKPPKIENEADKPERERKVLTFDEVKSQHDLDEAILATDKIREKSVDMSEWTTQQKIANLDLLSLTEIKTATEIADKEIDIANKKMADNKTANNLALKNNKNFATQHAKNILDIEKTNKNEIKLANEVLNGKILESNLNTNKATKVLNDEDLKATDQLAIAKLNTEIIAEKLIIDNKVKGANKTKAQQEEAFKEYVKLSLAKIDLEEKMRIAEEPNPIKQEIIKQNFADLRKGIENILSPVEEVKKAFEDLSTSGEVYNKSLSESLDKLGMSSLKTFLDFDEFGQSSFQKMWENADTTQKKTTVMFQAIGDAAQQYFGMMEEASEANFQEDLRRLDAQKQISLGFAGDSAAAKEKIEKDYDKKRKELELKQFKEKQKMAVANIAIDTGQAIMQIWAHSPDFSGISQSAMSVIIGALGAVQIGMVLAQKPPAYADGTDNHSGGLMLVNDGAGSNFQEKVILPSGKVIRPQGRNVLMNAPKGTKVLNHEQQLFEMLQSNNISMSSPQYQGMTPDEMDEILGKHFGNIKTQNTIFDKNGFQSYVKNGNSITRSNSNRSQAIGISV